MMKNMLVGLMLSLGGLACHSHTASAGELAPSSANAKEKPVIQVAILLDTSGSMSGLIHQTRTELWSVVNALTEAKKGGESPVFEVALYEYGQSPIPASEGHLRMLSQFTGDLDKISEELFRLSTNGGDEFSGAVIESAVNNLQWSGTDDDLKIIFIAGNEPFTQGPVHYPNAINNAGSKNIIINTIHCGDHQVGINDHWEAGALIGRGDYFSIDHNDQIAYIDTPFDQEISQLNLKLNGTYIPYGSQGHHGIMRQQTEDTNAAVHRKGSINRSLAKSSQYYSNSGWDLVDAINKDGKKLESFEKSELPEYMQKMSKAERKKHVDAMILERKSIQKKMAELKKKRASYLAAEAVRQNADKTTLEQAMLDSLRKQAKARGYIL